MSIPKYSKRGGNRLVELSKILSLGIVGVEKKMVGEELSLCSELL
jgi:hypothetical protein